MPITTDDVPKATRPADTSLCDVFSFASSRIFTHQCLLRQVEAAQGGHLEVSPLRLTGQQRRVVFFDPTRLHNSWHERVIMYNVNAVKTTD